MTQHQLRYQNGFYACPETSDYDDPEYDDPGIERLELYGDEQKSWPVIESDLRFLRDFILHCALYIEELEADAEDTSPDFWEAREHAYRIITSLLVDVYRYERDGE